ncbi:MAG: hypothetical protein KDK29_05950 [Sedimentitalea sp.]|nr:hypothetical protein [Sedimentitalea sp.]
MSSCAIAGATMQATPPQSSGHAGWSSATSEQKEAPVATSPAVLNRGAARGRLQHGVNSPRPTRDLRRCRTGRSGILAGARVPTCPGAVSSWLAGYVEGLERVGIDTGPLAVWLWNALTCPPEPIICIGAHHAGGLPRMMSNEADRHKARGLARIVPTGWSKAMQIKSHVAFAGQRRRMTGCF